MGNDNHITLDREYFDRAIKRAKLCGAYTTFDTIVFLEKEIDSYRDTIEKMKTIPNAARIAAEPKPKKELKPLNTKIFVLDGAGTGLKTAHVYNIINGKIIEDDFIKLPMFGTLYNMDDVVNYLTPTTSRTTNKDSAGKTLSEFSVRKVTVIEVKEG